MCFSFTINVVGKRIWWKLKNRFKINKLIIYVLFKLILFVSLYYLRTKKFKNMKIFDYICFSFIFSTVEPNMIKSFSLSFFPFP